MTSNRILYCLAILLLVALFAWTGSAVVLAASCVLVVFAALLGLGVLLTRFLSKVRMRVPSSAVVGGKEAIELSLERGLPFSLALISLRISSTSATFRTTEQRVVVTALNTRRGSKVRMPLDARRYGRMEVTVDDCCCEDPLGLFRCRFDWTARQSVIVHPESLSLTTNVRHIPLSRSFGTTYDAHRSGSDVDEVFDIREFQPGDHLSSVHWKLTSKFDAMMSRQFSRPVDFELIVVSLGSLEDQQGSELAAELINGVASVAEALSSDMLQQGLYHSFALPLHGSLMAVAVDCMEALDSVSELVLDAPISQRYHDAVASLLASEMAERFTKCILVSSVYDERLWSSLALEMDLSVVLVVHGSGVQEVEDSFNLVVVDTQEERKHERCIAL